MSRIDKISFIRSYGTFHEVYSRLENFTDKMLDSIIKNIIVEMRCQQDRTAIHHVMNVPIYLN